MSEQGKNLTQCVNAISAYGQEINALRETLDGLLLQSSENIENADWRYARDGDPIGCDRMDDSGWVYSDVAFSIPLWRVRPGRHPPNPDCYLGYQISLSGDGIDFTGNDQPLLHVFLWNEPSDLEGEYLGYPLNLEAMPTLMHNRLIVWPGLRQYGPTLLWTFSIYLLSLDNHLALLDRVVNPAIALASLALLEEDRIVGILPDWDGLVRYENEEVLTAGEEDA